MGECKVKGCKDNRKMRRGYCYKHYRKLFLDKRTEEETRKVQKPTCCSVDGCGGTYNIKRGYCNKHYLQVQRYGKIIPDKISYDHCLVKDCEGTPYSTGNGYCQKHAGHIQLYGKILPYSVRDKNKSRIRNGICEILLKNKYGEKTGIAMVDIEDREKVLKHKWYLSKKGYVTSRIRKKNETKGNLIYLHHFILERKDNTDHKDRNPLNNCKDNLRNCTRSQNSCNKVAREGTSKFKCVWRYGEKYIVYVRYEGKRIYGGEFDSEIKAAKKANELMLKYHKEFSVLNEV